MGRYLFYAADEMLAEWRALAEGEGISFAAWLRSAAGAKARDDAAGDGEGDPFKSGQLVRAAVKAGLLERPHACEECGAATAKIQAAHYDYRFPYLVRWLCASCHAKWDRDEPKPRNATLHLLSLRLAPDLHAAVVRKAASMHRSIHAEIVHALEQHVGATGTTTSEDRAPAAASERLTRSRKRSGPRTAECEHRVPPERYCKRGCDS